VEIILECARRTKRKHKSEDQIFGDKSAHLLWQHCGQAGQAYVLKNLEVFTDEGLRELLCLSEQLDANVAAQTLLQAELTSLSETELITAAQENNCWYLALENQLRASQRCFGDDGEAGTIPPNYAGLIQRFAQNSAGKLDFTHIEQIEPPEERIEEEGSQVTFQFCGEKYTIKTEYSGDWFELTSIEAGLRKILKQHKIGDRFLLSIEHGQCFTYYFAPEKVFAPIAEKFGIRYYDEKGKSPDKTEWRKKIIERIKKAAKSTRR
jgi:hypothetical protein